MTIAHRFGRRHRSQRRRWRDVARSEPDSSDYFEGRQVLQILRLDAPEIPRQESGVVGVLAKDDAGRHVGQGSLADALRQLAEAVEMVVIGAALSLLCATAVLAIAESIGLLDWQGLVARPRRYLGEHPFRLVAPMVVALALSYASALGLARVRHTRHSQVVHPSLTMWQQAFWLDRPSDEHSTITTIELTDGRTVTGMVRGFSAQLSDCRELMLGAPIAIAPSRQGLAVKVPDAFLVIREDQLVLAWGRYWPPDSV